LAIGDLAVKQINFLVKVNQVVFGRRVGLHGLLVQHAEHRISGPAAKCAERET
jgi:hypothetical protein